MKLSMYNIGMKCLLYGNNRIDFNKKLFQNRKSLDVDVWIIPRNSVRIYIDRKLVRFRSHHAVAHEKRTLSQAIIFRWFYRGPMSEKYSLLIVQLIASILSLLFSSEIFTFFSSENGQIKILYKI
jgi:hypothetical protein